MCVNDILVSGAEPLYFLDYIACEKLVPEKIENIVGGIAEGCRQAKCALLGGETAEMPGMYAQNEYDLAGFVVGVVEKEKLITGESITPGDLVIGFGSSGLHSNGFSLVRKLLAEKGVSLEQSFPDSERSVGDILLTPTRIYAGLASSLNEKGLIKGWSHITGGRTDWETYHGSFQKTFLHVFSWINGQDQNSSNGCLIWQIYHQKRCLKFLIWESD